MQAVRECLLELTGRRGMTYQQVATELNCSVEVVRRIRDGKVKRPGFFEVAKLHQLAGRSLDPLIGMEHVALVEPVAASPISALVDLVLDEIAARAQQRKAQTAAFLDSVVADPAQQGFESQTPEQKAEAEAWSLANQQRLENARAGGDALKDLKTKPAATPKRGTGTTGRRRG